MKISCVILAGGRAARMGGLDKGLVSLVNMPLISHVIARMSPQVNELLINANREIASYEATGYPVLPDTFDAFIGPLAGFHAGLSHATHPLLLTVPCDAPQLPTDLAQRLLAALVGNDADIVVAKSANHTHPVISLCKKSCLQHLTQYIEHGGRKVSTWQKSLPYAEVDFTVTNTSFDPFANLNSLEDLATFEDIMHLHHGA